MQADQNFPPTDEAAQSAQIRSAFRSTIDAQPPDARPRTLAPYDKRCDAMRTMPAPIEPLLRAEHADYFERPIEHSVHQIWFGDPARLERSKPSQWQQMAELFGYTYRLYTEDDVEMIRSIMPARNADLLELFLASHSYHAASDIARISLLEAFGGIYVDCDMRPPTVQGEYVDIAKVFPMRNIVLMTEVESRNIGSRVSLFAANGLLMAAKGHPLIRHLVDSMPDNVESMMAHGVTDSQGRGPPEFMTGPFFLSRSLAGAVTVLPFTYLKTLHVL